MSQVSREKLLTAATELFARKSFSAVSIREISVAAGANSAMISYYFGNKEGLYREVLETQFRGFAQILEGAFGKDLSPPEKIREMARALLTVHRKQPFWLKLYYSEFSNPTPCFETVVRKYISRVAQKASQLITDGMNRGDFLPGINPNYAALSLAAMLNYYFLVLPVIEVREARSISATDREEEYFAQAVTIFLNGLLVANPPQPSTPT